MHQRARVCSCPSTGAAPIQAAIAAGETVTGVTTMFMDEGLDTGDIILRREVPIDPDDDAGTLHDKLAAAGAELLVETMRLVAAGAAPSTAQNDAQATYAPKIEREHGVIDWENPRRSCSTTCGLFGRGPERTRGTGDVYLRCWT